MLRSFKLPVTGFAVVSVLMPLGANAAMFSDVYIFGDSLSDTGNFYSLTQNQIPVSPPYYNGRLSNGPLWIEYLQQDLGITPNPAYNFALAGATTGSTNTTSPLLPQLPLYGLQQQVNNFSTGVDPNALYIVWAGSNDYVGGGITNPTIPVTNLSNSISELYNKGARNFLIPNLPDLGKLPGVNNSPAASGLTTLSLAHNQLLAGSLGNLSQTLSGVKIAPVDVYSLFNTAINNPQLHGFTNVTNACLPTNPLGVPAGLPCTNPDEYLFWDELHPTTKSHELIATVAAESLGMITPQGVPEPSAIVALVSIGLLGAGVKLKQKMKV